MNNNTATPTITRAAAQERYNQKAGKDKAMPAKTTHVVITQGSKHITTHNSLAQAEAAVRKQLNNKIKYQIDELVIGQVYELI